MGNSGSKGALPRASKRILNRTLETASEKRTETSQTLQDVGKRATTATKLMSPSAAPLQKPQRPSDMPNAAAFRDALKNIGIVDTNPFGDRPQIRSQKLSPAVLLLQARRQTAEQAQREIYGEDGPGRQFLDAATIRQILVMRDLENKRTEEIEKKLDLKRGVVQRLGKSGIVRTT